MKRIAAGILVSLALCVLVAWPAMTEACVGKTLFLGRMPGMEQEILAELFVWLVSERTGTSIEIKTLPDSRASHSALEKAKIDLYLEEPFVALRDVLDEKGVSGGGDDVRQRLRREYEEKYNLIWLEPWGFDGKAGGGGAVSKVAPVVRRDTLKKFPALSRLVNKMAGVLDNQAMELLLAESANEPVRQVTKKFLKQKKLI